jgi:hypothetical protein
LASKRNLFTDNAFVEKSERQIKSKLTQELEPSLTGPRLIERSGLGEGIMADRKSLGMLGFMFGGVTAAVMLIAVMVVKNHIDGRLTLDAAKAPVMASAVQSIIR